MTPDETGHHTTRIEEPRAGKWVAYCDQCGRITAAAQDYRQDAVAIAERHESIGGFEQF